MKKLPKYFIVKNDRSVEFHQFIEWLNKTYKSNWDGKTFDYYGYDGNTNSTGTNCYHNPEYFKNNPTLFTAKEIMSIINQKENMNKRQMGYRLKDEYKSYEKVVLAIFDDGTCFQDINLLNNKHFDTNSLMESKLRELGLLDLWFEQVYEGLSFKVGDWVKKVWNESEDIDIFQISKINGNNLYSDLYFRNGLELPNQSEVVGELNDNRCVYSLATPEEIDSVSIFKVGNFIYVKKTGGNYSASHSEMTQYSKYGKGTLKEGNIYKIIEIRIEGCNKKLVLSDEREFIYLVSYYGHYATYYRLATKQEETQFNKIEIGGYLVEFHEPNQCNIKGHIYTKQELLVVKNLMEKGQVKSLNVGCLGQFKVDSKLINEIYNRM